VNVNAQIRVADNKLRGVRTFYYPSRSRDGITHTCQFVRRGRRTFWYCTCEDFVYRRAPKGRHCDHIKDLRMAAKEIHGVVRLAKFLLSQQHAPIALSPQPQVDLFQPEAS
jgi:hypothetical protein